MVLVSRQANRGVVYRQANEPSDWLNGDLWVDTDDGAVYVNISGTATVVGASSFSASATVSYSEVIGDYVQPDAAVATSSTGAADAVWGLAANQVVENFTTYTTQGEADTAWPSEDTANMRVNITSDLLDFDTSASGSDEIHYDLGAGNVSDSAFIFRCKLDVNTFTPAGGGHIMGVVFSADTNDGGTSSDYLGLSMSTDQEVFSAQAAESATMRQGTEGVDQMLSMSTGDRYLEIIRLSTTQYKVTLYSDSSFETSVGTQTKTIASTLGSFRYVKVTANFFGSPGAITGTIEDCQFWDGVTAIDGMASNAVDDNTVTFWESQQETNPAIYTSEGENNNFVGVALYWNALTTETEIKIRVSTDTTFTSGETVRTILVSNLTDGAYNYIRFNVKIGRYLQIYGSSGSSLVMAINEIKHLVKTDNEILADLGVLEISPTDTSLALDGT